MLAAGWLAGCLAANLAQTLLVLQSAKSGIALEVILLYLGTIFYEAVRS